MEIFEVDKKDLEKVYANNEDTSEFALRRIKFDLSLFDDNLVDMKYLWIMDNGNYAGQGIIVFKDLRADTEFEYEKDLLNIKNCALIKNCYIEEGYRGSGCFSQLFKYMTSLAIKKGYNKLCLSVTKDNEKARKIYEHYGFKVCGEHKYNDIGETFLMSKKIWYWQNASIMLKYMWF